MDPITQEDALSVFRIAGFPVLKIWELVHSYYTYRPGEDVEETRRNAVYRATRPSWLVKTPYGMIELNLRKRVVEIDWSDTGYRATQSDPSKLHNHDSITTDNVTRSETYVHAWTLLKAAEYLTTLRAKLVGMKYAKPDAKRVEVALNAWHGMTGEGHTRSLEEVRRMTDALAAVDKAST